MGWDLSCAPPYPLRWPIVTHSAKGSHLSLCDAGLVSLILFAHLFINGMGRLVGVVVTGT